MISNDVLTICAFRLIEKNVKTTLTSAVAAPGAASPNVGSTKAMYVGAKILIGPVGGREVVTVTAVPSTTQFSAVFTLTHGIGEDVVGATFPSGQTDHPLFTQGQMLNALAECQNEFLVATRCVYSTGTQAISGVRDYPKPATAVRIEHIDYLGSALRPIGQTELDLGDRNWVADVGKNPRTWFEDQLDPDKYGFDRIPGAGGTANLWFSLRAAVSLNLDSTITVPDVCSHALIYGTLARAWGADGEAQNQVMAKYCQKRFQFIVGLTQRLVGDLQIDQGKPNKLPTMAVAAGGA